MDICTSDSEPTRAEIKRLHYLDAVLKEGKPTRSNPAYPTDSHLAVLRLYPSVPINSRLAVRTTTLPTGGGPDGKSPVLVRKGEAVGYCPYAMHRRQDVFGADAATFRPERWLEQDGRLTTTAGFGYLPFNAGPRLCLGRKWFTDGA